MSRLTMNALSLTKQMNRLQISAQARNVARWVAPTLRELRRRDKLLGPKAPEPRSGFLEWNYRAELFAFSHRLNEAFQLPLLQAAFTQPSYVLKEQERQRELGIEVTEAAMAENSKLADIGAYITKEYIDAYLEHSLPKVPEEGRQSFRNFLMSEQNLCNVSNLLGTKELIFDAEYPPTRTSLAQTLLAIIGALEQSSGVERAFLFVRDFIVTQLNQRDPLELWNIEYPEQMLEKVCAERNLGMPEPRLIGDCGKNTVLAAYHVGIYCNKEMIGEGYGENIDTARKTASLGALTTLFDLTDSMRPFNFRLNVMPKNFQLEQKM